MGNKAKPGYREAHDKAKQTRINAQIRGEKTYNPGFVCRNGHESRRFTESNNCCECAARLYHPKKVRTPVEMSRLMMGKVARGIATVTAASYTSLGQGNHVMTVYVTEEPARPRGKSVASPIPRLLP